MPLHTIRKATQPPWPKFQSRFQDNASAPSALEISIGCEYPPFFRGYHTSFCKGTSPLEYPHSEAVASTSKPSLKNNDPRKFEIASFLPCAASRPSCEHCFDYPNRSCEKDLGILSVAMSILSPVLLDNHRPRKESDSEILRAPWLRQSRASLLGPLLTSTAQGIVTKAFPFLLHVALGPGT